MMSNFSNTVIYIGVTNNLDRRAYEHRNKLITGFTEKYHVNKLVYFEECGRAEDAIAREKQLKAGSRKKKVSLIESLNPNWDDLSVDAAQRLLRRPTKIVSGSSQ